MLRIKHSSTTSTNAYTDAFTNIHLPTCMHMRYTSMHAYKHTYTHTHAFAHAHTHTHTHTRAHTLIYTHTHTHTHTHRLAHPNFCVAYSDIITEANGNPVVPDGVDETLQLHARLEANEGRGDLLGCAQQGLLSAQVHLLRRHIHFQNLAEQLVVEKLTAIEHCQTTETVGGPSRRWEKKKESKKSQRALTAMSPLNDRGSEKRERD